MLQLTAFGGSFVSSKGTVKSHSTEMLQRKQIIRGKEHWPPKFVVRPAFSLFTSLATTHQRLVTSPRDPGVASLHVNASHFSTTARRVTSPSWGPPPTCKQALKRRILHVPNWIEIMFNNLCLLEWEFKTCHPRSAILFGKTMRRLNQISCTYSFESTKISIWFGALENWESNVEYKYY